MTAEAYMQPLREPFSADTCVFWRRGRDSVEGCGHREGHHGHHYFVKAYPLAPKAVMPKGMSLDHTLRIHQARTAVTRGMSYKAAAKTYSVDPDHLSKWARKNLTFSETYLARRMELNCSPGAHRDQVTPEAQSADAQADALADDPQMVAAVAAVHAGMSYRAAVELYEVPKTILNRLVKRDRLSDPERYPAPMDWPSDPESDREAVYVDGHVLPVANVPDDHREAVNV